MRIAMVAPIEESVPPKKYGGIEVVVYNLITELTRLGHEVTLFGTGDSQVPCSLYPVFPTAIRTAEPYASNVATRDMAKWIGTSKVIEQIQKGSFDVVHNHIGGLRFNIFSNLIPFPMVTTRHGPGQEPYQEVVHGIFPNERFISISNNQRKSFPEATYVATVYNGIDTGLYPYKEKPDGDYLMFLARFSPEKGPMEAVEIARRTKRHLKMAIKVDLVDKEFFESSRPVLEENNVEVLGEIGMEEKVKLLQNAYALLAPIQWEEPFGLYAVEAMACGTPVVGVGRGAFPELITQGVDGFLGQTVEEMASYVEKIPSIDRKRCRQTIEERFSKEKMAEGYIRAFEAVVADGNPTMVGKGIAGA